MSLSPKASKCRWAVRTSKGVGEPAGSKEVAAERKPDWAQPSMNGGPDANKGVGEPAGSKEVAKRRTEAIRTVGPTLIK